MLRSDVVIAGDNNMDGRSDVDDSAVGSAASMQSNTDVDADSVPMEQSSASDSSHMDFHMDNSPMVGGPCFFADATLDLGEAHAIAETPEPKKLVVNATGAQNALIEIPNLQTDTSTSSVDLDQRINTQFTDDSNEQLTNRNVKSSISNTTGSIQGGSSTRMNRITNADLSQGTSDSINAFEMQTMPSNLPTYRPKMPRRPRDIAYAGAFVLIVPLSLVSALYPSPDYDGPHTDWFQVATSKPTRTGILCCILAAFAATQVLARILYRSMGGGDGDDARHLATKIMLAFAPISVAIHPMFILAIYFRAPSAIWFAIIPLLFLIRDVWALRHWRRGLQPSSSRDGMWHDQGRQTFFQALACMALDILSRSLRRSSFYRIICCVLGLQVVVVWLWLKVLLRAMAIQWGAKAFFCLCLALFGGKWATGTVARVLGLIASGGITSWFAQQSIMMEEMEQMKASAQGQRENAGDAAEPPEDSAMGDPASRATARAAFHSLPEAYKSADASAYMSVLDMDEGIDDDYEEEDEGTFVGAGPMDGASGPQATPDRSRWGASGSTVKAFLLSAMTVSFGSVAQCGLLGGLAQLVWSLIRNIDSTATMVSRRLASSGRFQGMQIGAASTDGNSFLWKLLNDTNVMARDFVRSHSDLAMSHVAAYFKNYRRASHDVFVLVDTSGVEPIIHDDITTHMCACVCGSVSGIIVIFVGYVLSHHQRISDSEQLSDKAIVESMFLAFFLCYTLLFTAMEPLRASIKAIYVCFAQHPQSLSQAFPLIFHRLSRISEATLV